MHIRHAQREDLPALEGLYRQARAFMAENGNPTQWGDDWPPMARITEDIGLGRSYLCEEGDALLAAFMFTTEEEPAYAHLEGGEWPDEGDYGVVHSMATGGARKGAGEFCLRWCRQHCRQLRIDTHEANVPMRTLLAKLGFVPCGQVYVGDGTPRIAYYWK